MCASAADFVEPRQPPFIRFGALGRTSASSTTTQQRNLLYDPPRTPSPELYPKTEAELELELERGAAADGEEVGGSERPWTANRIGGGVDGTVSLQDLLTAPPLAEDSRSTMSSGRK